MMSYAHKLTRILGIWVATILVSSILISCGTVEPTSTPTSFAYPSATIPYTTKPPTNTPEPHTDTPEPAIGEEAGGILLPSATPAPTLTPDAITEMISTFTEAQGLNEVTILRLSIDDWLNLGYSILLTIILGYVLSRLVYFILARIASRSKAKYVSQFVEQIRPQIFVIMFTFGVQVGTVRLDLLEALVKFRVNRLYSLIYVIASTVIFWHLVDVFVKWYQNEVAPKRSDPHQADTVLLLLHRFARVLVITISLLTVLSIYNVNVSALVAAIGVGGLAISLAAQDTLSNVISGIMIMLDQPFRVGDRIEIPKMSTWGDVIDIGLRSTRIRTRDNRLVILPNNTISTDQVINYTYPDPRYRIQIEIGVGYGQDIEKVRQVIIETVSQVAGVLTDKPVDALYVTMGDSAMIFRVRWWIESYVDTRRMFDRVNTALQKAFGEAGIALGVNSLDVNLLNKTGDRNDRSQPDQ